MAILEYLEIMINLDIEEDNSEILEYVLKVAYKFYPMVYEDSKGIMHVGGTKADEEFENWKNEFLNDNILTHIKDGAGNETTINSFSYNQITYDETGKVSEIKFVKN